MFLKRIDNLLSTGICMHFLDPRYDIAFKKLFGSEKHKSVTIAFLNTMLEYTGDRKIVSIEFMNNEQLPTTLEKKENILDISCLDQSNRHFIIEMHNGWERGFTKRILWYGAKKYVDQLNAAKPYDSLDPVIVLAITKRFKVFQKREAYKSMYTLADTKTGERDIPELTLVFAELLKFKKEEHELVTDEDKWLFLLNKIGEYEETPPALQEGEFNEACQALNRLTWSEKEVELYQKMMIKAQSQEAIIDLAMNADLHVNMALEQGFEKGKQEGIELGLEQGIELGLEKGKQEGIELGKQEGIELGFEKGKQEERREFAKKLLAMKLPLSQLCELSGLSEREVQELLESEDVFKKNE